jgi:hypothetical protein
MMAESQNSGEGAAIARKLLGNLVPASTIPGSSLGNGLHSMPLNNGGILGSDGFCAVCAKAI